MTVGFSNIFFFIIFLFCNFIFRTKFCSNFPGNHFENWKVSFSFICSALFLNRTHTYDFRVPLLREATGCNDPLPLCLYSFVLQPQSYEAVEPLDLEEFLMSQLRSGDATLMQELGEFPDDDLKVEQFEKECRTVQHSVPKDGWVTLARSSYFWTNCETASLIAFSVGRSWIHKWETVWRVTSSHGSWSPDGKHNCHSLGVRGHCWCCSWYRQKMKQTARGLRVWQTPQCAVICQLHCSVISLFLSYRCFDTTQTRTMTTWSSAFVLLILFERKCRVTCSRAGHFFILQLVLVPVSALTQGVYLCVWRCQGDGWSAYSERAGLHKLLRKQTFESDVQPEESEKPVRNTHLVTVSSHMQSPCGTI